MTDKKETPYQVVLTIQCDQKRTYSDFVDQLRSMGLVTKYQLAQVPYPALSFQNDFIEHIINHGLNSMLRHNLIMEEITSPSMSKNDVEAILERFVRTLFPATRLIIIDPYFYTENAAGDTDSYLTRILGSQASTLKEVFIVSNGTGSMKAKIQTALSSLAPSVTISDVSTKVFHDRFWLNPDSGSGIIMGTSLNGLGRKIALVDKLNTSDVQDILVEVRKLNSNI